MTDEIELEFGATWNMRLIQLTDLVCIGAGDFGRVIELDFKRRTFRVSRSFDPPLPGSIWRAIDTVDPGLEAT